MEKDFWKDKHFSFLQNRECEYFPCHAAADPDSFNCLFCYCPLYTLGNSCGGSFVYLENGVKDCSACILPHRRESYGYVLSRWPDILELAKKK